MLPLLWLALASLDPDLSVPNVPALTQLDPAKALSVFTLDPTYRTGTGTAASLKPINFYAISRSRGKRVKAAWSFGFMPVVLEFSDGRCFIIKTDYIAGAFRNSKIEAYKCGTSSDAGIGGTPLPPKPGLRFINRSFGFDAWSDDRAKRVFVTNAWRDGSPTVLTTSMNVIAIGAMRSPDSPGADISFIGNAKTGPEIVTLGLSF